MKPPPFDEETFLRFFRTLDERQARLCAAERALALGRGGVTRPVRVTGLSHPPIPQGMGELDSAALPLGVGRVPPPGAGRKKEAMVTPGGVACPPGDVCAAPAVG